MISHNVYFDLKDASEDEINRMIADCHKWLKPIEGIVHFAAGRMLESHNRDVNVRDYHVGTQLPLVAPAGVPTLLQSVSFVPAEYAQALLTIYMR